MSENSWGILGERNCRGREVYGRNGEEDRKSLVGDGGGGGMAMAMAMAMVS
jgi:hypothetical protein